MTLFTRLLSRRLGLVFLLACVFLIVALITRMGLLVFSASIVDWKASLLASFAWGLLFDLGAFGWIALPLSLILCFLPATFFLRPWGRILGSFLVFASIYAILFGAVAEFFFWEEFSARFNFIAVDYLIYTKEVLGNIQESYPMPLLLSAIGFFALWVFFFLWKKSWLSLCYQARPEKFSTRIRNTALLIACVLLLGLGLSQDMLPKFANNYNRELSKNGLWSLFAAFKNNELEYEQFYSSLPLPEVFSILKKEVLKDGAVLLAKEKGYDTLHMVTNDGPEQKLNVIQITIESMSKAFMTDPANLTPYLNALTEKSLVFDNFYASGSRTVRGMEALVLSFPPTPGRSLVKRPNNGGLFSLGSVLRAKSYDTAFIYSGYGYFDNMNTFFDGNGYRIIDRATTGTTVTFGNIWGACDQNLYQWTLDEADKVAATNKPFHFFVMTTSNHRPYTFPEGCIDLPSKVSGRAGAVKYTDFAIGEFLQKAEKKSWYKNTVFVFVADHCASSAGKVALPVDKHHIPLIIYAPGGQLPTGHIKTLCSQMDYAPTLLGLLNMSYPSRFIGQDVRKLKPEQGMALMGNYQSVGLLEHNLFSVLRPTFEQSAYAFNPQDEALTPTKEDASEIKKTISFYQSASYLYGKGLYLALSPEQWKNAFKSVQKK